MTKKDFEAIAASIANMKDFPDSTIDYDAGFEDSRKRVALNLADVFEDMNPRFDRKIFLLACNVTE